MSSDEQPIAPISYNTALQEIDRLTAENACMKELLFELRRRSNNFDLVCRIDAILASDGNTRKD